MTVMLARLDNVPERKQNPDSASRRREPRFSTWFDARLENAHGDSAMVLLAEVSLHGCRIQAEERWLRTGAFVSISKDDGVRLQAIVRWVRTGAFVSISKDDGVRLQAIVRWVRDGAAGMEFLRPIPRDCSAWHDMMDEAY